MFFRIAAILVMAVFYGFYFYKLWDQTNRGIKTNYLGEDKIGFIRNLELALKAVSIVLPIDEIINIIRDKSWLPDPLRVFGLIIAAAGTGIFILSALTMSDNWRVGVPVEERGELVTHGIYEYSRNPAFLGFDLMYFGILLMFFSIALFVLTAGAIAIFHLQIVNVEEDYLTSVFKDRYIQYKSRVNRYFGKRK